MSGLYKEQSKRYFAASNTKDGFVSYFDEIFSADDCDRVYIIKGGPGCGKSTFMKKLGCLATQKGFDCEYFFCSSDPESLDGIIIKDKRIAVIDGTSPHSVEPSLAGAREIIIDLGTAWDTDELYKKKKELSVLSDKKKQCYKECYNLLYSKNVMDGLVYNLVFPNILFDKLDKAATRLSKHIVKNSNKKGSFREKIRINSALSSPGKIRLSTFEDMAEYCVFLKEPFCGSRLSHMFLCLIYDHAKKAGLETFVSFCPDKKGELCALYFPSSGISVTVFDEKILSDCDRKLKKCKIVNCARFLDIKTLSRTKPLRKFYCRLSENMENGALEELKKAGKIHADTEKIYRTCTCYTTVEKISDEYINKILNS